MLKSLCRAGCQVTEYLGAGARQFGFMLRGLRQLEERLAKANIPFFMLRGDPTETVPKLVADTKAAALVTDFAPLRHGRQWRDQVGHSVFGHIAVNTT